MMDAMKDALSRKRGMSLDITILMDGEPVGKQMVDLSGGNAAQEDGDAAEAAMFKKDDGDGVDENGAEIKDKSELAPPGAEPVEKEDVNSVSEMTNMLQGSPKGGLRDKVAAFWNKKNKV